MPDERVEEEAVYGVLAGVTRCVLCAGTPGSAWGSSGRENAKAGCWKGSRKAGDRRLLRRAYGKEGKGRRGDPLRGL